jgi:hypothetical protein
MKLFGDRRQRDDYEKKVERDEGPAEKSGHQCGSMAFRGDGLCRLLHLRFTKTEGVQSRRIVNAARGSYKLILRLQFRRDSDAD